jgi:YYY domain-containing protein
MSDVASFSRWWLILTLFGLVTWPILFWLFRHLPDRGYSLSKTGGLLAVGFTGWLFGNFGLIQISAGGVVGALLIVAAISAASLRGGVWNEMRQWLRVNWPVALTVEIIFLAAFAGWAYSRALNPNITFTEKPMEFAFLNSVLRTGVQPPGDPWLSGYAISYYHFGYVIMGMLIALSGVLPSVGFNLGIALLFALTVLGAFGVVLNLIAAVGSRIQSAPTSEASSTMAILPALLGPLFMLTGNLNGFLEVMHKLGKFPLWFWQWLDIKWTNEATTPDGNWMPDRFLWWWQASRVIHDRNLTGAEVEVIDEFPFFSFLLGDMHPHVLGLPFVFLAIAFALNLFLMVQANDDKPFHKFVPLRWPEMLAGGILLGGLSFLNTWDFPIYLFVVTAAYGVARLWRDGWIREVWRDTGLLAGGLLVLGIILYLPFYIGFRSQLGGVLPNVIFPTKLQQFVVMFGPSLLVVLVLLGWLAIHYRAEINWRQAALAAFAVLGALILVNAALSTSAVVRAVYNADPQAQQAIADLLGEANIRDALPNVLALRLWGLAVPLLLALMLMAAAGWLLTWVRRESQIDEQSRRPLSLLPFVVVLILTGALLALGPEFVYLRDLFATRMNTIFKFYYQVWVIWSLAAAFGVWLLMRALKPLPKVLFAAGVAAVLAMGLMYPPLATATITENWQGTVSDANGQRYPTLDGMAYMTNSNRADDYAAIQWLNANVKGRPVIAEAVGGSYTDYGRVAVHTGLPTVVNWPFHQMQWRGGAGPLGSRESDISTLYSSLTWTDEVKAIMDKYDIRYVYVGQLEREKYGPGGLTKFDRSMRMVYQAGSVAIYERTNQ